ncbi:hypothetical protein F3Y22_tig00111689pilonHSYRG00025 [Hibiscus syriacus]|uniref:Ataxin 2 SM domain-containing protein n=1 Tax=Hibiscus syriacus TaxID=106335 RepID=A0A6A2XI83_HIBSY|nr:polyadenylate-binding protein-interacting protein 3-like [Hibiscus syriacus]KAE8675212.1 hypothetical protein F3Y22_tig00111689pilonHSYRG00025 [Hibiscus syriacus]
MGLKNIVEEEGNCSVNEALLFVPCSSWSASGCTLERWLCYSGIFHTASVEKEYGIVLKKAKFTKKGRCATNVADGSVVETCNSCSCLVQVVAKGVPFPFDGFAGNGEAASEFSLHLPIH